MEHDPDLYPIPPLEVAVRDSNVSLNKLYRFMEVESFPNFSLPRGPRDGKFIVEMPNVPEANDFKELMLAEMPDELISCHPIMRRMNIFIRMVPNLESPAADGGQTCIEGLADYWKGKKSGKWTCYIRIDPNEELHGDVLIAYLVATIAHEIAEVDYYLKSPDDGTMIDKLPTKDGEEYNDTEDEETANRRAIRLLRRRYPDAGLDELDYPIDRE